MPTMPFLRSLLLILSVATGTSAWQLPVASSRALRRVSLLRPAALPEAVLADIEAGLEPTTGEAVEVSGISDCRVLRLGRVTADELEEVELEAGEEVSEFWVRMTVPGEATQAYMSKLMAEAKKNANFPGFRPGQIPPYARPQMVAFAMEEAINTGLLDVIDDTGLKAMGGDDAQAKILEDIKKLSKTFKPGTPLTFTATFRAKEEEKAEASAPTADAAEAEPEAEPAAVDAEIVG